MNQNLFVTTILAIISIFILAGGQPSCETPDVPPQINLIKIPSIYQVHPMMEIPIFSSNIVTKPGTPEINFILNSNSEEPGYECLYLYDWELIVTYEQKMEYVTYLVSDTATPCRSGFTFALPAPIPVSDFRIDLVARTSSGVDYFPLKTGFQAILTSGVIGQTNYYSGTEIFLLNEAIYFGMQSLPLPGYQHLTLGTGKFTVSDIEAVADVLEYCSQGEISMLINPTETKGQISRIALIVSDGQEITPEEQYESLGTENAIWRMSSENPFENMERYSFIVYLNPDIKSLDYDYLHINFTCKSSITGEYLNRDLFSSNNVSVVW